ncbi:Retrovirus-related Pol polyprotein from transposon 17.6 [Quillaja saponaria]|uniref:Retrovirus-related Pol polyprotein from transposon 17.6 n=1 Tax=Quillaja saponaria TaxID=32244 RepID=A0AAD7Q022_QUISA|nr:Retrovirus-related Pol polyprotein from transposon 17.6 [Quillaja saponaria]
MAPERYIKAQALADFIVKCTFSSENSGDLNTENAEHEGWLLYVDGSSDKLGGGAGANLRFPDGQIMECAIKFDFTASNNAAEYEALILGLRWARAIGADELSVFCDSQLVVKQITDEYVAREIAMIQYLEKVKQIISCFTKVVVQHIPRNMNGRADELSKLHGCDKMKARIHTLKRPSYEESETLAVKTSGFIMDDSASRLYTIGRASFRYSGSKSCQKKSG